MKIHSSFDDHDLTREKQQDHVIKVACKVSYQHILDVETILRGTLHQYSVFSIITPCLLAEGVNFTLKKYNKLAIVDINIDCQANLLL